MAGALLNDQLIDSVIDLTTLFLIKYDDFMI